MNMKDVEFKDNLYYKVIRWFYRIKDLRYRIKYAIQRAYRGYDDVATSDFDSALNDLLPALKIICHHELETDYVDLNPERKKIYTKTLKLIDDYENADDCDFMQESVLQEKLWSYVGKNINVYWT